MADVMFRADRDQIEQHRVHRDQIDAERLRGERLGPRDLGVEQIGRHRAARDHAETARVRDRRDEVTFRNPRSEEHTSELQTLMRTRYAVFCLNKKNNSSTSKSYTRHSNYG